MMSNGGPKINPWGTPDLIFSHKLYEDPVPVLCF